VPAVGYKCPFVIFKADFERFVQWIKGRLTLRVQGPAKASLKPPSKAGRGDRLSPVEQLGATSAAEGSESLGSKPPCL